MIKTFVRRPITPELAIFSIQNQEVSALLQLVADDFLSWVSMYRIIEADMNERDAIAERGWATKTSLRNFKHTANSPSTIGPTAARHGRETGAPPSHPMKLEDAQTMVRNIVLYWLEDKYKHTSDLEAGFRA